MLSDGEKEKRNFVVIYTLDHARPSFGSTLNHSLSMLGEIG